MTKISEAQRVLMRLAKRDGFVYPGPGGGASACMALVRRGWLRKPSSVGREYWITDLGREAHIEEEPV